MRRTPFLGLLPLLFACALAACGGGSSGGSLPPTSGGSKPAISLHGGFAQSGAVALSSAHRLVRTRRYDSARSPLDLSLSALPLVGVFDLPDSYVAKDPEGVGGPTSTLIAYLNTSDNTMTGIPNALPTPLLSQAGPSLVVTGTVAAPSPLPSAPPVSLGGFDVSAPSTAGQTTLTLSATVGTQTLSTTVTADTWPGMCVQVDFDTMGYGCAAGLYWDASGVEHTTTDQSAADVFVKDNGDGTSTLTFPYGAAEVTGQFDKITTIPTIPAGPTTFSTTQLVSDATNSPTDIVFAAKSGVRVKWGLWAFWAPTGNGLGLNQGALGGTYGPYMATTSTTFAY